MRYILLILLPLFMVHTVFGTAHFGFSNEEQSKLKFLKDMKLDLLQLLAP